MVASLPDTYQAITRIQTPSLIIWGDGDRVLHPSMASHFDEVLPNSEMVMLERVGHLPMLEAPFKSAKLILDLVNANARAVLLPGAGIEAKAA